MKRLSVFALLFFGLGVQADETGNRVALPPDLASVPADALGFVHIRVADIWKLEGLKDLRETLLKAGEKNIGGFDARFLPHPSSIDRLTIVALSQGENLDRPPLSFALLATNKAIDKEAFLKSSLPNAVAIKTTGRDYYFDEKNQVAVTFVSKQILAFGPREAIEAYNTAPFKAQGNLTPALYQADSKKQIVLGFNASMIPAKELEKAPPAVRPLLKAKLVTLAFDLSNEFQIDLGMTYADAQQAKDSEEALKALAVMGRNELKSQRKEMLAKVLGDGKPAPLTELPEAALSLWALGSIERIDEFLADMPVKRDGDTLRATIKAPGGSGVLGVYAMGVGLMLPAVQKVREAAARAKSSNNLKQIGLALHNYHDANGAFPSAAICDKNGKPLLSWRVAILPYIEQLNLYNQFKLDEPWDSKHNLPLSKLLVNTYIDPNAPNPELGLCYYRLFHGKEAMFDLTKGRTLVSVTDGTSNTFMVVEAAEGVIWTKPDDFAYDAEKPLPKFANFDGKGFLAAYGDGSVHMIGNTLSEKTLRALITANGGEVIDPKEVP